MSSSAIFPKRVNSSVSQYSRVSAPYRNYLRKKRLGSKLHRRYVLNLLYEPQYLTEVKTPKLLKIPNKVVTNLRERKLKKNQLSLRENKLKEGKKCPRQFSSGKFRVLWRDWLICEIRAPSKKNTRGGEEKENCYLKFKNERDSLQDNTQE